jgi:hypothetical protein
VPAHPAYAASIRIDGPPTPLPVLWNKICHADPIRSISTVIIALLHFLPPSTPASSTSPGSVFLPHLFGRCIFFAVAAVHIRCARLLVVHWPVGSFGTSGSSSACASQKCSCSPNPRPPFHTVHRGVESRAPRVKARVTADNTGSVGSELCVCVTRSHVVAEGL